MPDETRAAGPDLSGSARALLDAVVAIGTDLDIHSVLLRIVRSACEITGARYGALGVLGGSGVLVDFITHGISDSGRAAIGDLPRGHGILGLLIDEPRPLRLQHLQEHPKSYGFPAHHPPMERFLGVPVRIRGTVFGNLYLTEKTGGGDFTEEDEKLVEALATAAGFVIDNARAYTQSERRRRWLEAASQIGDAVQAGGGVQQALLQVAISTRRVVQASTVAVLQRGQDEDYEVAAVDGTGTSELAALVSTLQTDIARAEDTGEMVGAPGHGPRTVVLVPLRARLTATGVLLVVFEGSRGALDAEESELLASFADQAALALDRAQALTERQELMLITDRDRIARDLHDLVIQRLFATGLQLQGVRRIAVSDEVSERIDNAVRDLDVTIGDIRSTIFELQHARHASLRDEIRGVVKEYVPVLGFTPLVRTTGPVDTVVTEPLTGQLLAVLREALSNVARHADADAAVVEVDAADTGLVLRVTDNGTGLPEERRESGLRNVRRRATEMGGTVRLLAEQPHGTRLEWAVPLR